VYGWARSRKPWRAVDNRKPDAILRDTRAEEILARTSTTR
jgi:hypothetical protein